MRSPKPFSQKDTTTRKRNWRRYREPVSVACGIGIAMLGLTDFYLHTKGIDLWQTIGISLPEVIRKYSFYIAVVLGVWIILIGKSAGPE